LYTYAIYKMGKGLTAIHSMQRKHYPNSRIGALMRTILRGIANKAKRLKKYRFLNLYTMLNEYNLLDSWRYVKKDVAYGVDRVSAREFEQDLQGNACPTAGG